MTSSSETRRSTSEQEKSSTLPKQPDGKLFILKQGQGAHLQDGRLQESSPSKW